MKITFLVSGSVRSNFTHRALKLAAELGKRGHDVAMIAPSADKYNNFIPEKIDSLEGVRIYQPFQFNTRNAVINLLPYLIGAAYRTLRRKSDIIYIYKPTPVSAVGLVAQLFSRSKVVLDMDDLGSEVMKIEGHPAYQRKLVAWSERLVARYADSIVAASTFLRDIYRTAYPHKPVLLMPNGADHTWFNETEKSEYLKRIVFMGAINRKNILEPLFDVLPLVLQRHPDLRVVIIGDGICLPYFKEKASTLNLGNIVSFTGWLPLEAAKAQLYAGDIGYCYMPDEGTVRAASNMKIPQYMSRGMVPLVSDVGDLPVSVDYGKAGYIVRVDDPKELAAQLLTALDDPTRERKSEYAREYSKKMFDWTALADNFEQFIGAVGHTAKTRIAVICTTVPGNVGGAEIRNFNLIKQLIQKNNSTIDLFCITEGDPAQTELELEKALPGLRAHAVRARKPSLDNVIAALCIEGVYPFLLRYRSSKIGDLFRSYYRYAAPDAVHIEQMTGYYCIERYLPWLKDNHSAVIFDAHNVEARLMESSLSIFPLAKRIVGKMLLRSFRRMEIRATEAADTVITCSEIDANFFRTYNERVIVVPNGVDSKVFMPAGKKDKAKLLFIGGVAYPPNEDAVMYYLKEIHPLVLEKMPRVETFIVGATPSWMESKGIDSSSSNKALGFVADIAPQLAAASVGICPIRYGSGTRLKALTYMAAGLPVVSTTKGVEGIDCIPGTHLLIADTPQDFANHIVDILSDSVQYDAISHAARELIITRYDWDVVGKNLLNIYAAIGNNA